MSALEGQQVLAKWSVLKDSEVAAFERERDSGVFLTSGLDELTNAAQKYRNLKNRMTILQKQLWNILSSEQKRPESSPSSKKLSRILEIEFGDIKHKIHHLDTTIAEIDERIQDYHLLTHELQNFSMDSVVSSCISFPELEHENYGLLMIEHAKARKREDERKFSSGIEDYTIVKELRRTLQGKLVEAISKSSGERVAIKMCRKDLIESHQSLSGQIVLEDAYQETVLMKKLQFPGHRNVMRIVDNFSTRDEFCIVLEYAGRGEFFDIISQAGRLDEEVARGYFIEMAQGLKYLHDNGVCHLDLSLENILMSSEGEIVISDFGLARSFVRGESFSQEDSHQRPGKVQYMSPEIFAGFDFFGDVSDCFSMGVILFILLAGFPPFHSPSLSDRRFAMLMKGKHSLNRLIRKWNLDTAISQSAVDLLSGLLCPAEERMTMDQVLSHEWLTQI